MRVVGGAVLVGLAWASLASAATHRVPEDYSTINAAIDVAASGDSILVGPGTWGSQTRSLQVCGNFVTRRSVMFLKPGLTVIGTAGPELTILDGGSGISPPIKTVLMSNLVGAPLRVEGFTITGDGNGVAYGCTTTELALVNCHLSNNGNKAVGASDARITMEDCVVSGNEWHEEASQNGAVFLNLGGEFEALNTRFEANSFGAITAGNLSRFSVDGCEFLDHGQRALQVGSCLNVDIRNSLFLRNREPGFTGAGAIAIVAVRATIQFCTFAYDSALAGHSGAVSVSSGSNAVVRNNTFYRCYAAFLGGALGVSGSTVTVSRNVAIECEGAAFAAFSGSTIRSPSSGCNVLWNSENYYQWPAEAIRTDAIVDPRLCDAEALDFRVSADSPCLPENHVLECADLIGAFGAGCPSTGTSVIALLSNTLGANISGDGIEQPAPGLYSWPIGTSHVVGALAEQTHIEGVRFLFDSWSDGGSREHAVTVPGSYSEITANFNAEYFMTTLVDSGGSVSPSTWVPEGTGATIGASPASGRVFVGWLGFGDGSYTGLDNPATVWPLGPVSQKALFVRRQFVLTMLADSGGAVTPLTGPQDRETSISIQAIPDPGFAFVAWGGDGNGSYTGPDNPASVLMLGPITQTARFIDQLPLLTMVAGPGGAVTPLTAEQSRLSEVEIEALPDEGHTFVGWAGEGLGSYTGFDNPRAIEMHGPITQAAAFYPVLEMQASEGGGVVPETGGYAAGTTVEITGVPDAHHVFREWRGSGIGSFSGPSATATATVTVNEPLVQVAHFDRTAYELSLSLSGSDPFVHQGAPIGLGKVYLWLACGTSGEGIRAVRADVVGDLSPIVFVPAPGVLNAGDHQHLDLVLSNCVQGETLLGEFTVLPPGEGSLCLSAFSAAAPMAVTNCDVNPTTQFLWPGDVKMTGVSTSAAVPCSFGRGCDETVVSGSTPVSSPPPVVLPTSDQFAGAAPNPFIERTSLSFSLRGPTRVALAIYDVAGRRVRRVLGREMPGGFHSVDWNGRDDAGRLVPGGMYFVRLEAGTFVRTRKVAFLGTE